MPFHHDDHQQETTIEKISDNFKRWIARWCYVKVKKIYGKKTKQQKFDAGKAQATWHQIIDKVNEIIDSIGDYKTENEIRTIIEEYGFASTAQINSAIDSHDSNTTAHTPQPSDRRLKTNITFIGTSPSGINIYRFKFIDGKKYGRGFYQGVMSDEVPESVVVKDTNGYDMVDYEKIDVDFVKVNKL
tara:strand:- start:108 stop:668 length:561 start_codon:yes stop_codon:yes gene_type:complete